MKRLLVAVAVVGVLVIGSVGAVFAQTATPTPQTPPYGPGPMGWGYWNSNPASNPTIKRLADKIGISATDLVQQLQSGKSVVDVAGSKVSEQDLITVLMQPRIDMLNVQVKYGYLTQDQANSIQQYMTNAAKYQLEQKGFFGGYGYGPGMMGGGFGFGPGMMHGFGPGF
jgi:hypothetical protein